MTTPSGRNHAPIESATLAILAIGSEVGRGVEENVTNHSTSSPPAPPRVALGVAACHANADLAKLVAAWPAPPEAMQRAVLAIVEASAPQPTATELDSKGLDSLDTIHLGYESAKGRDRSDG